MKQITKAWLNRASEDLEACQQLLANEHLTNIVSFHAQQAVEKTLKAVIEELEIGFIKTHNLQRLYELIKPHYDIIQDMDTLEQLDAIYTESRYPNEMGLLPFGKPTIEETRHFYDFANKVYKLIRTELEDSTNKGQAPPADTKEDEVQSTS